MDRRWKGGADPRGKGRHAGGKGKRERTQPLFPAPTAGASWSFYGPSELMWNPNMNVDDVFENPFGPDDPWLWQVR